MVNEFQIYTDGACLGNPGPGGWGALIKSGSQVKELKGSVEQTTNNRMEVLAAIKGLEATPEASKVIVFSDSQYLVNTMIKGWHRRANLDLWTKLDYLTGRRNVDWQWIRGHAGHPENERADRLANEMAGIEGEQAPSLTHLDSSGRVQMVDVGAKAETEREAVAKGSVTMKPKTLRLIVEGALEKGDVLAVARVAGIMAAKQAYSFIPLCHPIPLTHVSVEVEPNEDSSTVDITASVKATAKTGAEMEALTAVAVAALTVYDMAKAVEPGMRIEGIRLVSKRGGKSGHKVLE